jgi:hypothetical protein
MDAHPLINMYPPCHSYTNDAALLLPTHVLSGNYVVMSRSSHGYIQTGIPDGDMPGFFAVVATENDTQVTVDYTAYTMGGDVGAETPGASRPYTLQRGEVLQVISETVSGCSGGTTSGQYCDMGADYDLTGTRIEADKPVAVFSGHDCAFVPFDVHACDHLEEQLMPLETWGKEFIVGRTEPQSPDSTAEPNVVRILSGGANNEITFNPAQNIDGSIQSSITLGDGEYVEFMADSDFHVMADEAIAIGQFLVGQTYYEPDVFEYRGDPAYSLMVPSEQFRTQYSFLTPGTITYNYVNIIKRVIEGSAPVNLDGQPVPESVFRPAIGNTEWGVASVAIDVGTDGEYHTIESSEPFGITVYGFAVFTSYSYPGGLDLKFINPVE